ncbi:stearoyl-[acyl-carrier-protein] 9-desaturase 6, chloroplastic-like [Andrographis paniculata]|uniref:stearoyl-[acyl-carrier-protein] 9-desaturase 6, chloroplastic-like n=1 Tax=Andrographis paniculata TaxID=175694 RepID=UPI0021E70C8F|nr:stearoyl-[acyl-carrier-protein] 9-desaturase 6, chloroplastic-like [Andrographis paniculata]
MEILTLPSITPKTNLLHARIPPAGPPATSRHPRTISATATKAPPHHQITHSMPPEKVEVFKSLEPWATETLLPFLKPVEKSWQPCDFLPDPTLPDSEFTDKVWSLRKSSRKLPDELFIVLVGDMVTEEAVPTYQSLINSCDAIKDDTGCSRSPWAIWTRGWSAEENRHGDLLRNYLYLSGRVDMRMIDKTVQYLIGAGMNSGVENNPYLGYVYVAFQERATFLSHANTGRLARDQGNPLLANICGIIAADEKRHESAYIKMVEKLLEVDPNDTMLAIGNMMRKRVVMPGHLMHDGRDPHLYDHFASVARRVGVFSPNDYVDIVEFLVGRWHLEKVEGLKGDGRREQDFVCRLAPILRKMMAKEDNRAKNETNRLKFSWIFNKEVIV